MYPNDLILCELCDVYYTRSNKNKHWVTRAHKRLQKRSDLIKSIIEGEVYKPKVISSSKFKEYLALQEIKKKISEID